MSRALILNSGGFDSVCLINHLNKLDYDITSLFFNYGQKNLEQERTCARRVADKVGAEHIELKLPRMDWSKSSVIKIDNKDINNQYIEYRNLIFLSYAKSIAESKCIRNIYVAFLKQEDYYKDTSPQFINWFNSYDDIKVHAPYIDKYKEDLIPLVRSNVIEPDDFFSCNLPNEKGEPCGECSDCKCIEYIYDMVSAYLPEDIFLDNNYKCNDNFYGEYIDSGLPTVAKLYVNNSCQFTCKHCLYGFKDTKDPVLSTSDFFKIIDKLAENGVTTIDFTGKEPLIDKKVILGYAKYIKDNYPEIKITTITNGENIFQYTKEELNLFDAISMSVEDTKGNIYRGEGTHNILDRLKYIIKCGVEVSVSIDLTKKNCKSLGFILRDLYNIGVTTFYVKPIIPMGDNGKNVEVMTSSELMDSLYILSNFKADDITKIFELKMSHINMLANENSIFRTYLDFYKSERNSNFNDVIMDLELYCDLYSAYHITPDGYLLGCGFMLGSKDYDKLSPCKFLECDNLEETITIAKVAHTEVMKQNILGCYFSKYSTKRGCLLE